MTSATEPRAGVKDSIERIGEDHAMRQVLEGGGPSGHCGHSTHADETRRKLDDLGYRLDHIEQAEVDQEAELTGLWLLASQISDSVKRLLRRKR